MQAIKDILSQSVQVPEPFAIIQSLPKCGGCGAVHPAARKPKMYVDNCPDCGHPIEYPEPVLEKAKIGGITGLLFAVFIGLAKGLLWLGRLIQPKKD
jgi:hypothetical protein